MRIIDNDIEDSISLSLGDIVRFNERDFYLVIQIENGKYSFQVLSGEYINLVKYDSLKELSEGLAYTALYRKDKYDLRIIPKQ